MQIIVIYRKIIEYITNFKYTHSIFIDYYHELIQYFLSAKKQIYTIYSF